MANNRTKQAAQKLAAASRWRGVPDRLCQEDAGKLEAEADALLTPETDADVSLGEVVPPVATDSPARSRSLSLRDTMENPDQVARDASAERTDLLLRDAVDVSALAIDAADSIEAGNSLEKMLAHQLALAHKAAFEMADKGLMMTQRIDEVRDPRAMQAASVESVRLMNASARMMQAFQQGLTTLKKIRTGGSQTMTVQHVQVADGGQAVIGNVSGRGASGKEEENGK